MDGFKDTTRMKYMMGGDVKAYKTGGPVKKAMGGAMKSVDKDKNPGLSKLPTDVRNKMGYMKEGGPAKMAMGGTYNEKGKRATLAEMEAEDRRMANRKPPVEGVSTRPTDASGRRATDADLGMTRSTKKPMPKGLGAVTDRELQMLAKPMLKKNAPNLGAVTDRELQMLKKAVPAYSDKPMIRRGKGGLMAMPKGKC